MVPYYSDPDIILREFELLGIPASTPGFYDHPNFLEAEKTDPSALRNYARFVHEREYDSTYLARAAKVIRTVADVMYGELQRDGRLGGCVDVCMVVSRILEAEGIWNSIVAGSLTIDYPQEFGAERRHFWWFDINKVAAAHAWLFAPPYRVLDITIRQQHHEDTLAEPLPKVLLAKNLKPASIEDRDLVSPEIRHAAKTDGLTTEELIRMDKPDLDEFVRVFPPGVANRGGIQLKYIPWQMTAPDAPLKEIKSLSLNGNSGWDIYEKHIRPKLRELGL